MSSRILRARSLAILVALNAAVLLALSGCGGDDGDTPAPAPAPAPAEQPATANLAVLSTTDLHFNVRSYDYFKLAEDKSYGFERTATLIRQARTEFANSLLVDNGDTIQGTALADYEAQVSPVPPTQQLSVYKAMGVLKFDAGTLGNHEFNYGLPFLNQVLGGGLDVEGVNPAAASEGPGFPMVLANVLSEKTKKTLIQPYTILERRITATRTDGTTVTLPIKIGFVGVTTPGIMNWDKRYLEGKVSVVGGLEAAQQYVPEVRQKGADLVFLLLHGGMQAGSYSPGMENPGASIAKEVQGIDGMVMGHQHGVFPDRGNSPAFAFEGVDNTAGTVHGVPAVMASSWGKGLGVLSYSLKWNGSRWQVDSSKTKSEVRAIQTGTNQYVAADPAIAPTVEAQHQKAIQYVKTPIGKTDFRMSTIFADVGDPGALQLVNEAQQAYVAGYVRNNLPQYANIPVLSITAPFKAGFQGGTDYTDVAQGDLAIFNAADLYLYPNTVYAVKITGAQMKLWLENAAQRFNQIDPASSADQWLIKDSSTGQIPAGESAFPGYNFDVFTSPDIRYEIDVTQPRFNVGDPGKGGHRVKNLTYQGTPVTDIQEFIVATNNYRAESSARYILGSGKAFDIIYASPDANRDVLISYIKGKRDITRAADGSARSWRFTKASTAGKVLFKSGKDALGVAQAAGVTNVSMDAADDGTGKYAVYRLDLSKD